MKRRTSPRAKRIGIVAVAACALGFVLPLHAQEPSDGDLDPRSLTERVESIAKFVDHEVASGRPESVEEQVSSLAALIEAPIAAAARFRALIAIANWHRDRVNRPGERTLDRMFESRATLDRAFDCARTLAEQTEARELRGYAGSFLGEFEQSRRDLEAARAGFLELGDRAGAARCLRRFAYLAFREGRSELVNGLLDRRAQEVAVEHATGPRFDNTDEYLRILANIELGEIDQAAAAASRQGIAERALLREAPYPTILWSYRRSQFNLAVLAGCAVAHARKQPNDEAAIFALLAGFMEGARVRALRAALCGFDSQPEGFTLQELRPHPESVVLLRYLTATDAVGENRRLVLLASRAGEQRVVELGDAEALDRMISEFVTSRLGKTALEEDPRRYAHAAHELAAAILGPVVGWLREPRSWRLLIVADGALARLPFQSLVLTAPPSATDGYADLDYLVRHASVLHLPSFGVLDALAEPTPDRSCLALLAPDAGSDLPLRFAALEEEAIRSAHPELRVLTGREATKAALLHQLATDPPGWLHLACHASSDPSSAQRAILQLAGSRTEADATADLHVTDVATLPIARGTRVVLSACGTANGDYIRGEGVLGLWRAFLAAGASCVVSTLKEVDDRSAAVWCGEFHRSAARGNPLADAARDADLAWLSGRARPRFPRGASIVDPAHPALWASYLCVGDDGGTLPGRSR